MHIVEMVVSSSMLCGGGNIHFVVSIRYQYDCVRVVIYLTHIQKMNVYTLLVTRLLAYSYVYRMSLGLSLRTYYSSHRIYAELSVEKQIFSSTLCPFTYNQLLISLDVKTYRSTITTD